MTGAVRAVLERRTLGRSTLDRQLLLRRSALAIGEAVARVAGIQAQTPRSWYTGLWSRLEGFRPEEASGLLADRTLVRAALMRSTIHLVTAADCLALRSVVQPVLDRELRSVAGYRRNLDGIDPADLAGAGRGFLRERPLTPSELGALMAQRWPDRDPSALAYAVRNLVALVQVPPRGLWDRGGRTRHAAAEDWLGRPVRDDATPDQLITRYLAAFGPASVADMQAWSGLTGLGEVVDRNSARLATFCDPKGRVLYDLPEAALPDPDLPAPVRFLPDYDDALLAHADRSRIATEPYLRYRASLRNGPIPGTVLVDGQTAAVWTVRREKGRAAITIEPFTRLSRADAEAVTEEAGQLLAVTDPGASHDIRLVARRP